MKGYPKTIVLKCTICGETKDLLLKNSKANITLEMLNCETCHCLSFTPIGEEYEAVKKKEEERQVFVFTEKDLEHLLSLFKEDSIVYIPIELQAGGMGDTVNLITHALEDRLGKKLIVSDDCAYWAVVE